METVYIVTEGVNNRPRKTLKILEAALRYILGAYDCPIELYSYVVGITLDNGFEEVGRYEAQDLYIMIAEGDYLWQGNV